MTIPTILGQGVLLFGILLLALLRLGTRKRSATPHLHSERHSVASEPRERVQPERWPDSRSLAGMPLRILLSDRSGPGTLLRDTLTIRPSTHDR
jgi:hypothetical protein